MRYYWYVKRPIHSLVRSGEGGDSCWGHVNQAHSWHSCAKPNKSAESRSWKKKMSVTQMMCPKKVDNEDIKIDTAPQRHEHFQDRMQFVPQLSEGRAPCSYLQFLQFLQLHARHELLL